MKSKKGGKINIAILKLGDDLIISDHDKAQHFLDKFYSVYTSESTADFYYHKSLKVHIF